MVGGIFQVFLLQRCLFPNRLLFMPIKSVVRVCSKRVLHYVVRTRTDLSIQNMRWDVVKTCVNIDHVAPFNARGSAYPDPVRGHLGAKRRCRRHHGPSARDRRHTYDDIERMMDAIDLPLNFEMAATDEMQAIALRHKPCCLHVPERREERTAEGGLEVAREKPIGPFHCTMRDAGVGFQYLLRPINVRLMPPITLAHG